MGLKQGGLRTSLRNVTTGAVIPDSAIHRWILDESSGTTLSDSIGSISGTVNGATWVSGNWQGSYALEGDGTDDFIDWGDSTDFDPDSAYSITATIQTSGDGVILHKASGGGGFADGFAVGLGVVGGVSSGQISFHQRNSNSNDADRIYTNSTFNDGNKHRVGVTWTGTSGVSNMEIAVDGSFVATTTDSNEGFDGKSNSAPLQALAQDTFSQHYLPSVLDNVIYYNSALSESEFDSDFKTQPWV